MPPKMKTPKREPSSRPQIDPSDLSDEARKRLVRSDAAWKRAAHAFPKGMVPRKFLYRAVPKFDRLRAAARIGAGSSSRVIVRRAPPPEEEEVEGYDPATFGRSLSALDFVPENAVDAVVATMLERSAEEEELEAQRRHVEAANEAFLQQPIDASLADSVPVPSDDE